MTLCSRPYLYCEVLEELKTQGYCEEEAIKELDEEHCSEWHPDRELRTPGQLSATRTQTQEEYEALYGRVRPVDNIGVCERGSETPRKDHDSVPQRIRRSISQLFRR